MPTLKTLIQKHIDSQDPPLSKTAADTFLKMADFFDKDPTLFQLTPFELQQRTGSPHEAWRSFLRLPIVDSYARAVIQTDAQVAFRKAVAALSREAATGNTSAAKQVTEISNVLQEENTRRTVVLTYVPRQPLPKLPKEAKNDES